MIVLWLSAAVFVIPAVGFVAPLIALHRFLKTAFCLRAPGLRLRHPGRRTLTLVPARDSREPWEIYLPDP